MKILCDDEIDKIAKKEFESFFDDETTSRKFSNKKAMITLKELEFYFRYAFLKGYDERQFEEIKEKVKEWSEK